MTDETFILATEGASGAPVKRFVRNKDAPKDQQIMRERMVSARVMNGLTAVDAAARLGYANSTQLSMVESGKRKVPDDWAFLKRAALVYSVSVDYLLGLSVNPERDAIASESFAFLRGFEQIQQAQAHAMTIAFIKYGTAREAGRVDLQGASSAMDAVIEAMDTIRRLSPAFDEDVRGGDRLVTAVERLIAAQIPLKETLKRRVLNEQHALDVAQGKAGPLASYLADVQGSLFDAGSN
jgi:transcriptional regulator with XRE-family HTH domain